MNKAFQWAETRGYWSCLLVLSRLACLDCIAVMFSPEVPLSDKLYRQALTTDLVSSAAWEELKHREGKRLCWSGLWIAGLRELLLPFYTRHSVVCSDSVNAHFLLYFTFPEFGCVAFSIEQFGFQIHFTAVLKGGGLECLVNKTFLWIPEEHPQPAGKDKFPGTVWKFEICFQVIAEWNERLFPVHGQVWEEKVWWSLGIPE